MKIYIAVILGSLVIPLTVSAEELSLKNACASYASAMEMIKSPRVPFPVVAISTTDQAKSAAAICADKSKKDNEADAKTVQDSTVEIMTAAAPYAGER